MIMLLYCVVGRDVRMMMKVAVLRWEDVEVRSPSLYIIQPVGG